MHLQATTLLSAVVESQKLLSTTYRRLHGTAEHRVEKNQSRTRQKVDEHDTKPEVDVEIDVHVLGNKRGKVDLTADDRRVGVDKGRQLETLDSHLDKPSQLG